MRLCSRRGRISTRIHGYISGKDRACSLVRSLAPLTHSLALPCSLLLYAWLLSYTSVTCMLHSPSSARSLPRSWEIGFVVQDMNAWKSHSFNPLCVCIIVQLNPAIAHFKRLVKIVTRFLLLPIYKQLRKCFLEPKLLYSISRFLLKAGVL